jgi:hypothetical protein
LDGVLNKTKPLTNRQRAAVSGKKPVFEEGNGLWGQPSLFFEAGFLLPEPNPASHSTPISTGRNRTYPGTSAECAGDWRGVAFGHTGESVKLETVGYR